MHKQNVAKKSAPVLTAAFSVMFALAMSGCGKLDFTLKTLIPDVLTVTKPSAQGLEVISGATAAKLTANNYKVDASVGAVRDKLETRTANGYRVFHGVKGAIASE